MPDLAGSFPFDTVITSILSQQGNLHATNFIRFLKYVPFSSRQKRSSTACEEGPRLFVHQVQAWESGVRASEATPSCSAVCKTGSTCKGTRSSYQQSDIARSQRIHSCR